MAGYFNHEPKEDEVLLTPEEVTAILDKAVEEYADVAITDADWEMKKCMIMNKAQLTKAREAVEGAEVPDCKYLGDNLSTYNRGQEMMKQAILKALGGE